MNNELKCNAVDLFGVWSVEPLTLDELKVLHSFDSITGVQCFSETEKNVKAWTVGAQKACVQFRDYLKEFVNQEVPYNTTTAEYVGYVAFCNSLKSCMG